ARRLSRRHDRRPGAHRARGRALPAIPEARPVAFSRALPRGLFQKPAARDESSEGLSQHPVRDRSARSRRSSLQGVEDAAIRPAGNTMKDNDQPFYPFHTARAASELLELLPESLGKLTEMVSRWHAYDLDETLRLPQGKARETLGELIERLRDNYPFFH